MTGEFHNLGRMLLAALGLNRTLVPIRPRDLPPQIQIFDPIPAGPAVPFAPGSLAIVVSLFPFVQGDAIGVLRGAGLAVHWYSDMTQALMAVAARRLHPSLLVIDLDQTCDDVEAGAEMLMLVRGLFALPTVCLSRALSGDDLTWSARAICDATLQAPSSRARFEAAMLHSLSRGQAPRPGA